jgi:N-acetylneuraminic acid mutarotase
MDSIKIDLKKLSASTRHQTTSVPVQGAYQQEVFEKIWAEIQKLEKTLKNNYKTIIWDSLTGLEK